MNCFEARQEFAAFWRATMAESRRAQWLAHLKGCAKCDHAFRLFALSAPVLHCGPEPADRAETAPVHRDYPFNAAVRRFAPAARRESFRWLAMAAAAAIFVLSGSAAYLAARIPGQSLTEALSSADAGADNSEAIGDPFGIEQPGEAGDFAS